jgi:NifB/MoaA-like Fe-S oxidoreductase
MKKDMLDTEFGSTNDRIKSIDKKINIITELLKSEKKESARAQVQDLTKNMFNKDSMVGLLSMGNTVQKDNGQIITKITPKTKLGQLKMQEGTELDVFTTMQGESSLKLNELEI